MGDYYDKCFVTNWGLVYLDSENHSKIRLLSHENWKEKTLWSGDEGTFDFMNYDDSYLYGYCEDKEIPYIGRISFRTGELETICPREKGVQQFDVLNGWLYYYGDVGKMQRRNIESPNMIETIE